MLFIGLPIALCFAMLFYRHPLWLLCLFPIFEAATVVLHGEALAAGGFVLLPTDPLYFFTLVTLGLCALLQPRKMATVLRENKFLMIFIILVAVYIVLYAPVYSAQRSLGEARKIYFMFLIPLLASVAIKQPEDLRRFIRVLVFAAAVVAIYGLGRAGMRGSLVLAFSGSGILILALTGFLLLVHRIYGIIIVTPIVDKVLLFLFAAMVLVSGQRSVWLAVGAGLMLMFWFYRSRSAVMARMVVITAFVLFGLSAGMATFPEMGSRLLDRIGGIINPQADANASWRIRRWEHQRDRLLEHGNLWFGEGLGRYERDPRTGEIAPSAHNAYMQTTVKLGLFGLLIYSLVAVEIFRRTLATRRRLSPGPMKAYLEIGIINFGAAHVYFLGYDFIPIALIFYAVVVSAVRLSQQRAIGHSRSRRMSIPIETPVSQASLPVAR